jgi:hypothetical protein
MVEETQAKILVFLLLTSSVRFGKESWGEANQTLYSLAMKEKDKREVTIGDSSSRQCEYLCLKTSCTHPLNILGLH